MAKQGELKFSYDNYEDDFHRDVDETGGRKDFNMQTSGLHEKKKTEKKEDNYEADFEKPDQSQVKSRVQDSNANR